MATEPYLEQPPRLAVLSYVRRRRLLVGIVVGLVVLVFVAALASQVVSLSPDEPAVLKGAELSQPRELPDLTLMRADGSPWSSDETAGRLSLFFFGYTSCPDVCPLTLSRARQVQDRLGADSRELDVYFVTVDPERDAPDRLGMYVSQFSPEFGALTGTPAQLEAVQEAFGVVAVRQSSASQAGYSVDHTASSFLVDSDGRIRIIYPHDSPSDDVVADVQALLARD